MASAFADLLVGTPGGLYLVHEGQGRKLDSTPCYGLSWDRERLYVGERQGRCVRAWAPDLGRQEVVIDEMHDVHQVLWAADALYATNTGQNTLDVAWGGAVERRRWSEEDLHLNSIWSDGNLLWVVEHRNARPPSRVRAFGFSFQDVVVHKFYTFDEGEQAWGLHNVYVEAGKLHTLSVGKLLVRDLVTGTTESIGLGGYLRGLARTAGRWYVGRSRLGDRMWREEGDAEVLMLDDSFKVLASARLKGAGQVCEVRALDGDWAHNEVRCPVKRALWGG